MLPDLIRGVVARLLARTLRLLGATWRVELRGENPLERERRGAVLAAVWHRNLLMGAYVFRDCGVHVPISLSRDGSFVAAIAERLGFGESPRGSSSRGSVRVMKSLVRLARSGALIAVLTDGPRGPARRSKGGVLQVARLAGVPVLPVAFAARPCWRFGSWDGLILPLPFARVVCEFGEPIELAEVWRDFDAQAPRVLDASLNERTDRLDAELGVPPPPRRG